MQKLSKYQLTVYLPDIFHCLRRGNKFLSIGYTNAPHDLVAIRALPCQSCKSLCNQLVFEGFSERSFSISNITVRSLWENGIVGAGGAGFPTHIKYQSAADTVIVNAAECEPLLHKDAEIIRQFAQEVLAGLCQLMSLAGAKAGIIAIKSKHRSLVKELSSLCSGAISVHELGDFYPAGDEFVTVYECTGRVIPAGGLPLHVGCIVNNVETILNAARNRPVTHKFLTVAGWVKSPQTLCVPVGMSMQSVLELTGGPMGDSFTVISGGVMMGKLEEDLSRPITKTTGGLLVFPSDHPLVRRYKRGSAAMLRLNRSACDQCCFCTQLCPRYLLGHPIQPHLAMRALAFNSSDTPAEHVLYCCECNLCSLMACPESLDPRKSCSNYKALFHRSGRKPERHAPSLPHPLRDDRRMPVRRIMQRLDLIKYEAPALLVADSPEPNQVELPLKQHVGQPSRPVVTDHQRVYRGQLIAETPFEQTGACLHASIDGVVSIRPDAIVISRKN